MDVVLLNPYSVNQEKLDYKELDVFPPLGLLYLAATLKSEGIGVGVVDATFRSEKDVHEALRRLSVPVVGISANLITRQQTMRYILTLKKKNVTVIVGGPDPTISPKRYVDAGADAVVLGEGESAFAEIIRSYLSGGESSMSIDGVMTRMSKRQAEPRTLIADIDGIPPPDLSAIDVSDYLDFGRRHRGYSILPILSARGCPYQCAWCAKPIFGNSYRARSPGRFVDELERIVIDHQPDRIRVLDDVFTMNKARITAISDEIQRRRLAVKFECLSRTDCLDGEVLTDLRRAGCYRIWCGFESGSQRVLDSMNKGINAEQAERTGREIRRHGIELAAFVMVGYPGETPEDVMSTRSLIERIRPDKLSVSIAYPLPGTAFHRQVEDRIVENLGWRHTSEYPYSYERDFSKVYYRFARKMLITHWEKLVEPPDAPVRQRIVRSVNRLITRTGFDLIGKREHGG